MTRVARLAAIAIMLGNTALVFPAFSQAPACTVSPTGRSIALQATGVDGTVFSVAGGYHLAVSVNGSDPAGVMVDTGSNALIVPSWKIKGFPKDPDNDHSGMVVSGKLPYGYSSSGNSYNGYLIQVPVRVHGAGGTSVDAEDVQVFAITEVCGSDKHCVAATSINSRSVGMMGVGFQPTPNLVVKVAGGGTAPATHTNVFQQVHGVATQGWIFEPGGRIVVGLNTETTQGFSAWAPMVPASRGGMSPEGCVRVTEPGKPESRPLCGTMLLDTGMSTMNLWVYSGEQGQAPFCPPPPASKAGFDGATFPPGTTVTLASPGKAAALDYRFDTAGGTGKGAPEATYCTNVKGASASENAFFNTGRMPLELYSFARNETCGTFAYRPRQ
ncbi:hypothetical protein [Azospirillum picis]|uniref:Uncharacterized protein n=1 Tax=Azospirillum picis TaxID=488438 RepID=A0ABU0MRC7_9PROT|nr:hypothetical protein [Azospirillum picis]MBP2302448.1 hypothetical protein [Azospirillum picis]MDQ0536027.1 hypothetical protein [Azospirillum picis]